MLGVRLFRQHFKISFFKSDNHYDLLDISKSATEVEIRKAYLKKAKQYHPDRNQSPDALVLFK